MLSCVVCMLALTRAYAYLPAGAVFSHCFFFLDRFLDCLYLGLILQSIRLDSKGPCLRLLIMPMYDAFPAYLTTSRGPYAILGL